MAEPTIEPDGTALRHPQPVTDDDFVQPGELYRRVMSETDREHLVGNAVAHLAGACRRIQLRPTALFHRADAD